jgi:rRNA maturation endonuclease Nob1
MGTLVRLKRILTGTDGTDGSRYRCLSCAATYEHQQQVCPECGGYDIRSTEWLDGQRSQAHTEQ